jgi:hypothetical protein
MAGNSNEFVIVDDTSRDFAFDTGATTIAVMVIKERRRAKQ